MDRDGFVPIADELLEKVRQIQKPAPGGPKAVTQQEALTDAVETLGSILTETITALANLEAETVRLRETESLLTNRLFDVEARLHDHGL